VSLTLIKNAIEGANPISVKGKVTRVVGMVIEGTGVALTVGELCKVFAEDGTTVVCEVVGFSEGKNLLMPLSDIRGLGPGSRIERLGFKARVRFGTGLLGRVIDGMGNPIDGKGPIVRDQEYDLYKEAPAPLSRKRISRPLDVGVRSINSLLTVGAGQRIGIFAGSGVGKSVLMGMMARNTSADVNVIALIGERGREVNEFLDKDLKDGLKNSVVIVVTSDQPPLLRVRGAFLAMTISEFFRDRDDQVLLLMDSLTRFAMAQREIGLAIGEPPTTRAYPPSVFGLIPKLLERAGTSSTGGAITAFFTVLVENDDMMDPIADTARATLDGHIVLSRELAGQGHFPAIDLMNSSSRCMIDIVEPEHIKAANRMKSLLATYDKSSDLINIGAYKQGTNPKLDYAIENIERVNDFLTQWIDDKAGYDESLEALYALGLEDSLKDEKLQIQA
jgi:flagellum-specific ATP synthase